MQKSAYTNSDYGIDAPPVIRNLFLAGIASIVAGIVLNYLLASIQSVLGMILLVWGLLAGASMIATGSLMLWSSKVGKLQFRERLIDSLALRGTETILDVGCGRGLLLNAAARRLTTGKAIGIDLWQSVDQSGNNREATLANARAEGVADIVEVKTVIYVSYHLKTRRLMLSFQVWRFITSQIKKVAPERCKKLQEC